MDAAHGSVRTIRLAALSEVPIGTQRVFEVDGCSILICRTSAGIFAIENRCTHQLAALQGGPMRGAHIFCPKHGARFDMRTGAAAGSLTKVPIRTFPLSTDDDALSVGISF